MGKLDNIEKLYELVKDKDYFVITTNVDHCFQKAGFLSVLMGISDGFCSRSKDKNNDDAGFYLGNEYIKMCIYT